MSGHHTPQKTKPAGRPNAAGFGYFSDDFGSQIVALCRLCGKEGGA